MKQIIILFAACLILSVASYSQKLLSSNVPEVVKKAYTTKFPSAKLNHWEMEDSMSYEVVFTLNGDEYSALFDLKGSWMETESDVKKSDLPKPVLQTAKKEYPAWKITSAEKSETPEKGTVYELSLSKGKDKVELQLSSSGNVLSKKMKAGEEKDDEDDENDDDKN